MAKRMNFSVVGLPHYTIWHLYEPTVEDLRHMEEMDRQRQEREREEHEQVERQKKFKEQFRDPKVEWEKDGAVVQDMVQNAEAELPNDSQGSEEGPAAKPEKEKIKGETS
jgi:mannan polymerase II complex ANP1 subunit